MANQITLKEISILSGVSIATASRFLADPNQVKPSTRRKIENALKIHKDRQGRGKSNLIAFVIPDISNPFFPLLLKGIESISRSQGYTLILCNSEGSANNEEKILANLLDIDVAGIVFICAGEPTRTLMEIVKDNIVPLIFLDRIPNLSGIQTVTAGNFEGMYQSAKYLITLGHRNILYIGGPEELSTEQERYKGFESAYIDAGLSIQLVKKIHAGYSKDNAYSQVKALLDMGDFHHSAICASNDLMAFGAYSAITEHRLRVPEDISLIGYDDLPTAGLLRLTTIRQPFEEMGRTAMLQLASAIADPYLPKKDLVLSTSIILRNSCQAIFSGDRDGLTQ
jgi:LacI family transcriptional regulator